MALLSAFKTPVIRWVAWIIVVIETFVGTLLCKVALLSTPEAVVVHFPVKWLRNNRLRGWESLLTDCWIWRALRARKHGHLISLGFLSCNTENIILFLRSFEQRFSLLLRRSERRLLLRSSEQRFSLFLRSLGFVCCNSEQSSSYLRSRHWKLLV